MNSMGDKIVVGSDLGRDYVNLMLKYEPPFLDERVRKAINLLIDRDEALQLLAEGSGIKSGPIPPAHKIYALPEDDPDSWSTSGTTSPRRSNFSTRRASTTRRSTR